MILHTRLAAQTTVYLPAKSDGYFDMRLQTVHIIIKLIYVHIFSLVKDEHLVMSLAGAYESLGVLAVG